MNQLHLARSWQDPERRWRAGPDGLWLEEEGQRRCLLQGAVEEAAFCLDASLAPCALAVSGGRLLFMDGSGAGQQLAASQPHAPLLAQAAGMAAVCAAGTGESAAVLFFRQAADGSFRGRRLLSGAYTPLALLSQGTGLRLFLGRRTGGILQVMSLDPLAAVPVARAEFSAPEPLEELQFVEDGQQFHYAFLSRGTLFADGVPLSHGEGAEQAALAPGQAGVELSCRVGGLRRRYTLAPGGWQRAGEEAAFPASPIVVMGPRQTWRAYESLPQAQEPDAPAAVPVPPGPPEAYREILSNQARLLVTLREKQELQQRTLFALTAKVEAQTAALERLRQRCEGLQTALQALEALYLR